MFLKKISLVPLSCRYGEGQKGLILHEHVEKGQALWPRLITDKITFTREELLKLKHDRPYVSDAVDSFSCQSGDDLFTLPSACLSGEEIDARQYINHSCEPNCGYLTRDGKSFVVAMRSILAGEELTIHYGMLETEVSLTWGLNCRCGAASCSGQWTFDLYRTHPNGELMRFAKPELIEKVHRMQTALWHASTCAFKRATPQSTPLLYAHRRTPKGSVVAHIIDSRAGRRGLKVGQSNANCVKKDSVVTAIRDLEPGEEVVVFPVNVYCDGVFDLFHLGHQNHLRNCSRMGERLLVGVVSDEMATSFKRQPVMTTKEREDVVSKFECTWKVISAVMVVTEDFLEDHQIDLVCISPEYENSPYYVVPQEMGIVRVMTRTDGISTTDLIERIERRRVMLDLK